MGGIGIFSLIAAKYYKFKKITVIDIDNKKLKNAKNLGAEYTLNFKDKSLISKIENILGLKLEIEFLEPRIGDVKNSMADNRKLKNLFPEIEPTPFDEGLLKTIEWFENKKPWEKTNDF